MIPYILLTAMVLVAIAAIVLIHRKNSRLADSTDILRGARERAKQRGLDKAFMDTEPIEDPYDRVYDLQLAMSVTEVDESANGYGMLDDEQKRVIAAIFDSQSQVPSSLTTEATGIIRGARWSQSVFGEDNRIAPIREEDIWSTSRN
jgi:ABC-type Fe2+-enterobactin transport system substrate-binding protein